jgi:hypothetical protein
MPERSASHRDSSPRRLARRVSPVGAVWRTLFKDLFDPYRPELHYMRGPGPKWREKQARASVAIGYASGELARAV